MTESILANFLEQKLDLILLRARLSFKDSGVCSGFGRLFFSRDQISSIIFGKLKMMAHLHANRDKYSSGDFLMTGRTTDGWNVRVKALDCPYNGGKTEGDDIEIQFLPTHLEFTRTTGNRREVKRPKFSYATAYIGPISEFIWTEKSTVETTRFGFKAFSGHRDCLSVDIEGTTFRVFQNDTGGASLHVKMPGSSSAELEKCLHAFINALSLLLGRYVAPFCKDTVVGKIQTLELIPDPRRNKKVSSPFPPIRYAGDENIPEFLTCAYKFFKDEVNEPLIWYLRMLWSGNESIWEINKATAGICVELLTSYVIHENLKLESSQAMRETIQTAGTALGVTISSAETKVWSDIRNSSCHWRGRSSKLEDEFQKYLCCVNLMHKLSAGLICWKGKLIDFTSPERESMPFPFDAHIAKPTPARTKTPVPRRRGVKKSQTK